MLSTPRVERDHRSSLDAIFPSSETRSVLAQSAVKTRLNLNSKQLICLFEGYISKTTGYRRLIHHSIITVREIYLLVSRNKIKISDMDITKPTFPNSLTLDASTRNIFTKTTTFNHAQTFYLIQQFPRLTIVFPSSRLGLRRKQLNLARLH